MEISNLAPSFMFVCGRVIAFMTFFAVGLSPWIMVNGLWSEIPILISATPEGNSLPAWLTVMIQIGNLACFIVFFLQRFLPVKLTYIPIVCILSCAIVVSLLISVFWHDTTTIGTRQVSVPLFALSVAAGLVGSCSMVTIFPWAALYGANMVAAVSTGSGSNGLITALFAVAQDASSSNPRFSLQLYFVILSAFILLSVGCFCAIMLVPSFDYYREMDIAATINNENNAFAQPHPDDDDYLTPAPESYRKTYSDVSTPRKAQPKSSYSTEYPVPAHSDEPLLNETSSTVNDDYEDHHASLEYPSYITIEPQMPITALLWHVRKPIIYQFFINTLYYLILGTLPFAFGSLTSPQLQNSFVFWANISGMIAGAIARLATFKFRFHSYARLFSVIHIPFFLYNFILCFFKNHEVPIPLLYGAVVSYAIFSMLFGYTDTLNFQSPLIILQGFRVEIQRGSQWIAAANQLGALVGATAGFALTITIFQV